MVRGRAAAAARGGVLSLRHRRVFSALACGVRAKDDGAIGILSITDRHTHKNGFNHVEGSKTARVAALAFFSPMLTKAKKAFAIIGVSPAAFAMHVLRVSGATEAARAMVPDRLRLNQGRWKSEITLRGYTRERLPIQVKVSKAMMGLLENGQVPEFI